MYRSLMSSGTCRRLTAPVGCDTLVISAHHNWIMSFCQGVNFQICNCLQHILSTTLGANLGQPGYGIFKTCNPGRGVPYFLSCAAGNRRAVNCSANHIILVAALVMLRLFMSNNMGFLPFMCNDVTMLCLQACIHAAASQPSEAPPKGLCPSQAAPSSPTPPSKPLRPPFTTWTLAQHSVGPDWQTQRVLPQQ